MVAIIQAFKESQKLESIACNDVTCIFCGRPTPVPASFPPRRISIVRCMVCGKEAPYRACDLFQFSDSRTVE